MIKTELDKMMDELEDEQISQVEIPSILDDIFRQGQKPVLTTPPIADAIVSAYDEIYAAMVEVGIDGHENAVKVVVASLLVSVSPKQISALTGVKRSDVKRYGRILFDNGVWKKGGVVISFDFETEPGKADNLWIIEIIMQAFCAEELVIANDGPHKDGTCTACGGALLPHAFGVGKWCRSCYRAFSRIMES